MPSKEQIEAAAIAIMIEDECGLMVNGKRALCDDASCGDAVELKCICRSQASAALSAAEGVKPREDALLESQYRAGYKAGWNAAHSDNPEEKYQAAMRYEGHLSALEGE